MQQTNYSEDLELFRKTLEQSAIQEYQAVLPALKIIQKTMQECRNLTTQEAIDLMTAIPVLGRFASEQWSIAVALEDVLIGLRAAGE